MQSSLATHIAQAAMDEGFDLSVTQEFGVDHATLVPLHFLTPGMKMPVVPIFVNGLAPPLPSGAPLLRARQERGGGDRELAAEQRVAVIGSGSFSLEIGGPKIPPGERAGTPDPEWAKRVQAHLEHARVDDLVAEATTERLARAGNIAGELLNWIAMLGVVGGRKPIFIAPQVSRATPSGLAAALS